LVVELVVEALEPSSRSADEDLVEMDSFAELVVRARRVRNEELKKLRPTEKMKVDGEKRREMELGLNEFGDLTVAAVSSPEERRAVVPVGLLKAWTNRMVHAVDLSTLPLVLRAKLEERDRKKAGRKISVEHKLQERGFALRWRVRRVLWARGGIVVSEVDQSWTWTEQWYLEVVQLSNQDVGSSSSARSQNFAVCLPWFVGIVVNHASGGFPRWSKAQE
jgi:hypothetical protein